MDLKWGNKPQVYEGPALRISAVACEYCGTTALRAGHQGASELCKDERINCWDRRVERNGQSVRWKKADMAAFVCIYAGKCARMSLKMRCVLECVCAQQTLQVKHGRFALFWDKSMCLCTTGTAVWWHYKTKADKCGYWKGTLCCGGGAREGPATWNNGWMTSVTALTFPPQGLENGTSSLPLQSLVFKSKCVDFFCPFFFIFLHVPFFICRNCLDLCMHELKLFRLCPHPSLSSCPASTSSTLKMIIYFVWAA